MQVCERKPILNQYAVVFRNEDPRGRGRLNLVCVMVRVIRHYRHALRHGFNSKRILAAKQLSVAILRPLQVFRENGAVFF